MNSLRSRNVSSSLKARLKQVKSDRKLRRYLIFSLSLDAVGYTAVYLLVSRGVLNTWWANTTVSKVLAPAGLILNTLALTGRLWPSRYQTVKWLAYWLPSAIAGMACLGLVVAHTGLDSIQARAVAGAMLFPFDFMAKRFIIFARQVRLQRFLRSKCALVYAVVLLWKEFNLPSLNLRFEMAEAV